MSSSLSAKQARARAGELRREILTHEKKYYVDNDPQISDAEFDRLVRELRDIEARFPELVTPESPTQRVGEKPIDGFPSVTHRTPMLSIDNVYNEAELREFEERVRKLLPGRAIEYVAELKIDGLGISIRYRDGRYRPGRHPRRRRPRRRRHGERQDPPGAAPGYRGHAGRRGPGRDLPALRVLPGHQPGPRGKRESPCSPTPATRPPAPSGSSTRRKWRRET